MTTRTPTPTGRATTADHAATADADTPRRRRLPMGIVVAVVTAVRTGSPLAPR